MKNSITSAVLRVVLPYVVIAGLWILLSDWLMVAFISDPDLRTNVSVAKGWVFVVTTALLLAFLLRIELKKREKTEQALRASENEIRSSQALLQAVTEGTPDAIFVKDINGNYLMANSGVTRILGKTREEILGKDDTALFSADDAQALIAGDRRIMESGVTKTNEELLVINGEPRTFLATKGPVRDPQNRVIGLFGISRDITERKRREKEVERMKRLYAAFSQINQCIVRVHSREELFAKTCQTLVEFSRFTTAWIGMVDQETKLVKVMAHYGSGEEYFQSICIYADDRPEGRGPTGRCIREARPYSCNNFVADPNTAPWREAAQKHGCAASFSAPICQGDTVCGALVVYATEKNYFGEKEAMLLEEVAFDISFALTHIEQEQKRRQAEESLRLSEEKFRLLVEHSPDPIFVQAGGRFAYLNQMAVHLFGARNHGDLLGQPVLERFHLDYREAARERIRLLNEEKISVPRSEEICLRLDGASMPVEISAVPIHFGGNDGALVFVRDITERKRAADASQFLAAAV